MNKAISINELVHSFGEKRVLQMCKVKALAYLLGNAIYIVAVCMILGAAIGTVSKNQMVETSLTMPVMMVLSFLPMLSMFNDTIGKIAKYCYTQQLNLLIGNIGNNGVSMETLLIVTGNVILIVAAFMVAYRKSFRKNTSPCS